ncbi:MAG: UDPglucose--hexose-1-phosphate uridylyltransferase [Candidatus Azotimanducaceae bacterium]|jgi:UDPglucose--hexose-1-phosphate uridylyltransferase
MSSKDQKGGGVWERRWHPLRNEWVTITSHRNARPWSSTDVPSNQDTTKQSFDADCYLCPGNTRVSGKQNDAYEGLFVFDNDHPSFSDAAPRDLENPPGIYRNATATGITRVMCYSSNHAESLAELDQARLEAVLDCWAEETQSLMQRSDVAQVLVFENKGEVIGVSNPHPHCQLYAAGFEFKNLELERLAMEAHFKETGRHLMSDVISSEQETGSRVIFENDAAIAFLPYFSRFPFESFVCPTTRHAWLFELSQTERQALATALRQTLVRYDNLWQTPFPYMLVLHQAPADAGELYYFHIQIHPLMRQPTLQKFLAGVESGGGHFLNDVDPDQAAGQLRDVSDQHYLSC